MNEYMKCYNIHGHTYLYELCFSFENMEEIGYAQEKGIVEYDDRKTTSCGVN